MVPAVARVLAQAHHELGEALAVAAEVVLEGLLEHAVHVLEVLGHGEAVVVLLDLAHDDSLARRREPTRVAGHHGTGHLQPGAGLLEAGRGEPLLLARVVGVGAGVEQGRADPAHAGDVDGVPLGGAEQRGGERGGIRLRQVRRDGHLDEGAPGGAVVHRQPRDQPPVGVVDQCLPPGPRADAGELAEHRLGVDARRAVGGPLVRGEERSPRRVRRRRSAPGRTGPRGARRSSRRRRSRGPLSHSPRP